MICVAPGFLTQRNAAENSPADRKLDFFSLGNLRFSGGDT